MTDTNTTAGLPQQIQAAMREMSDRVKAWWKKEGLGHTSEIHLGQGGMLEVEFSCSLYMEFIELMYAEDATLSEPARRARVLEQFESRGFSTVAEPGGDPAVRDCDTSRQTLDLLVKTAFPSAIVRCIESRATRGGAFVLLSMTVLIRDLADVFALPAAPAET
jgi:hypothetical protein